MIPTDWQEHKIEDLGQVMSGGTPSRSNPAYWNGNIPWITTAEIGTKYIQRADEHITGAGLHESAAKIFPAGTILIAMYGQGKTRGQVSILSIEATTNQACCAIIPSDGTFGEFLYYNLYSRYSELRKLSNDGSQKNLSGQIIKSLSVLLPPVEEQRRIADILSTWDRAIEATEKLIANSQAQKKALMQQLLTGKKRLPGFSGEWRVSRYGDKLKEIKRPVNWSDEDTYNLISVRRRSGGAFHRESLVGSSILTKNMSVARAGDFLISKMQILHGASAVIPPNLDGFHISGSYIALVPRRGDFDIRFVGWLSRTPHFYHQTYISSYGVHIEKMTFILEDFLSREFLCPPSKAEQTAIVDVLDAAEAQFVSLERHRDQLAREKSALMQQLLTGKRRVKLPSAQEEAA